MTLLLRRLLINPCRSLAFGLLLGLAFCLVSPAQAQNEASRRDYTTPGLMLESGARTGACDVLTFTADGKYLLATGDDKVVRNWAFTGSALDSSNLPLLRWKIWQDTRGQIFSLALSPDQSLVAVAGRGVKDSQIAVIDRFTGQVQYGMWELHQEQTGTVWSLAFAPNGKQLAYGSDDGTVWAWNLTNNPKEKAWFVGRHKTSGEHNFVRLVTYLNDRELVSVDEFGQAKKWPVDKGQPADLFRISDPQKASFAKMVLSPDRKWLAAAVEGGRVHLRTFPAGGQPRLIALPANYFPQSLAFDPAGKRLAVGARQVDQRASFHRELDGGIFIYDLTTPQPRLLHQLPGAYRVEAVCFHPKENFLAVAEGEDYAVSLWDLNTKEKVSTIQGPGHSLWSVALDADNPYLLGFKDQRNLNFNHPNQRGKGPWRVFDLEKRDWVAAKKIEPLQSVHAWEKWEVLTSYQQIKRSDTWFVRSPEGKVWKLDLDPVRYGLPLCWTFLPAQEGKPLRLAVGHYMGVSVFELPPRSNLVVPPRDAKKDLVPSLLPSKILVGQNGDVTALAISKDQKIMVTGSRDQTIAGWSLEDWPSHPELGASFVIRDGKLLVDAVDFGSPAWEVGLNPGDQLQLLVYDRKPIFNRARVYYKNDIGNPKDAWEVLKNPIPGKDLFFGWVRPNEKELVVQRTTTRQRPVWKFFPTRDKDWVLWRWRDYVYDASVKGDYHIGFQESGDTLLETPKFYRAEQLRQKLHQPKLLDKLFAQGGFVALPDIAPPREVRIEPVGKPVFKGGQQVYLVSEKEKKELVVNLSARARGDRPADKLVRAILWINDYQAYTWKLDGDSFVHAVEVPRQALRQGINEVLLQCYSHGGVRGESVPVRVYHDTADVTPDLFGIIVGVGDYRHSEPRLNDLKANHDAKVLSQLFQAQRQKYYNKVNIKPPLLDETATADNVLKQLQALRGQARPDDVLVLHLGGHGARPEDFQNGPVFQGLQGIKGFFFCFANFQMGQARATALTFDDLYKELVQLPCHKVVLLDTCRSGSFHQYALTNSPIRSLTPDGVGPIILAGCKSGQSALEHGLIDPYAFGVFTAALRKTMQEGFKKADKNKDGFLDAREFYDGVRVHVANIMAMLGEEQEPEIFLPELEEKLLLVKK